MRIRIGIIIGALLLGWWGYKEFKLASGAKATPQKLTCAELGEKGPGANNHVALTDFFLVTHSFVYAEKKGKWDTVWVPAVPSDGPYLAKILETMAEKGENAELPPPEDCKVIVQFKDVTSERALDSYSSRSNIKGLIINEIDSLGGEERRLLEQSYPGIDMSKCWILEPGRKPKSAGITLGAIGLAVAGIAGVVIQWVLANKKADARRQAQADRAARRETEA